MNISNFYVLLTFDSKSIPQGKMQWLDNSMQWPISRLASFLHKFGQFQLCNFYQKKVYWLYRINQYQKICLSILKWNVKIEGTVNKSIQGILL